MKTPSKDIAGSLRGQRAPGRGPEVVDVQKVKPTNPSMVVPGEGRGGTKPPGMRHERSAAHYGPVMKHAFRDAGKE